MWFKSSLQSQSRTALNAKKPEQKRHYGAEIEQQAEVWLKKQGLQPVERNYGIRAGEIDLIMKQDQVLVFIEVRYRENNQHGSGAETITHHKQQKLRRTAEHYLQHHFGNTPPDCRFDVMSASGHPVEFEWIQNAF